MSLYAAIQLSEIPPSVNGLFATLGRHRIKSRAYRLWLELAGHEINLQRPPTIKGPYTVKMVFGRKSKRTDLGNMEKALSDLLVAHRVVEDDRFAQKIVLEWSNVPGVSIMIISSKESEL